MSRHRVKNISYDDDDLDDEIDDNDDELSPEDREQMRLATIEVQQLLRSQIPAIEAKEDDIWETLWHYYYDVDKSVDYLTKKYRSQEKKETKAKASTAATKKKNTAVTDSTVSTLPLPYSSHFSVHDFFKDSPWLNIPPHRQAEILIEPLYPRLGLLGGSSSEKPGKMSKLAALAAARKKKEAERQKAQEQGEAGGSAEETNKPLSLRDRLAGGGKSRTPTPSSSRSLTPLRGLSRSPKNEQSQAIGEGANIGQQLASKATQQEHDRKEADISKSEEKLAAGPSEFAAIIIGEKNELGEPASSVSPRAYNLFDFVVQDLTEVYNFAEPSPDDVVINAQNAAKEKKAKRNANQQAAGKAQTDLAGGVQQLSVEPVKVKSKNLDVLEEHRKAKRKKAANFVVIGHVDAGKSTLMGRLLYDLKAVDQRTVDKYQREADKIGKGSFAFAWVLDQGAEERARGVTIDIASNNFETKDTKFTILDAPGHRDFVPNMIAGASQADFAVLVVDASTGKFESGLKGQTKEHALLVRSMGVQKMVIAVNKMDIVDWNKDRFNEIEQQISAFLVTAGFQAKNISFVPCSGLQGDNIARRCEDKKAGWYTGKTLIEELETSEPFSYALEKPLRMTIGDIFRGGIQNPLSISGRLDAGHLQVGDQFLVMPSGEKAVVKSLEVDHEPVDWAVAGQNVVLHLAEIDAKHLRIGDIVCSTSSPAQNITSFTAKVLAFNHLTPMHIDVHRGRLHVPGRITQLVATLDKGSGKPTKRKPKIVAPGKVARVVVELEQSIPLEAPARIVLRSSGETVAAGLLE
ncbi:translation elongation factor Tu [Trichophyton rubrum MR1459]|uniref:Elongation factor 1 alpha-like protein n=2 Tax=Trichophyton rubrum TaxID=5551 RepID=A0A178EPF8_TRIRU|nr:translation elongation factor Tu [Trichophyton rubrum CBS 118892]EGD86781.2 translation elongation factor Tu [Trichophyton rubrum CBS 118892]EZF94065.1 translation elongation factor Tu [Trichophyton rubrum MR1459]EZG05425.1 translation elongation factor Tu [Trichophyton rubrum CBS 735.88]OAL61924.1 elongation factor Tu [Trichophyton rubrum]